MEGANPLSTFERTIATTAQTFPYATVFSEIVHDRSSFVLQISQWYLFFLLRPHNIDVSIAFDCFCATKGRTETSGTIFA